MPPKKRADVVNFYNLIPKSDLLHADNPHINSHHITLPFRMLCIGSSGSGKTSTMLNIIRVMPNTWSTIIVITKNADEPLYKFLKKKIKDGLTIVEGLENLPNLDSFDKNVNNLVIFDDLIGEKKEKLRVVEQYYLRARKLNVSTAFLSQSYFKIPQLIRQNANVILIKKIASIRDFNRMASEYSFGIPKEQLIYMYRMCTSKFLDFLMILVDNPIESKFYHNFNPIHIEEDI